MALPIPTVEDGKPLSSLLPRRWPTLLIEDPKDALEEIVLVRLGVNGPE
jgi:hypothetical protein